MWIRKVANALEKALSPIIPIVGNIGSVVIAAVMFLTVADVFGRRFLNKPVTASYEISEMLLVIVIFSTIAYCQLLRGHVAIDLLISRLRQKTQAVINSLVYIIFLVTFGILSWQLYIYAIEVMGKNWVTGTILLPIYPFAFIAAIGCTLLCLVVFMHLTMYLVRVVEK